MVEVNIKQFRNRYKQQQPEPLCCLYYNGSVTQDGLMPRSQAYAIKTLRVKYQGWEERLVEVVEAGKRPKIFKV
jgi:hypothetical protein